MSPPRVTTGSDSPVAVEAGAVTVTLHRDLLAAEPAWRELETHGTLFAFQSLLWMRTWLAHLGAREGVAPLIVTVHAGPRPVMLLPLGLRRRFGLRCLVFLGGEATDYHAPLLGPGLEEALGKDGFAGLWSRILAILPPVDLIAFERMPAEVEGRTNPMAALPGVQPCGHAYAIRLPASLEDYRRTLRAGFVADTRRKRRRLAEIGPLRHQLAGTAAEREADLDAMILRKRRRFRETGAPDVFTDPAVRGFYAAMGRQAGGELQVCASRLLVGDETVAAHWGLTFRGRFYYLLIGWSGGPWARYSVGRVMIEELVATAIAEGHAVLDLTVGDEAYKNDWANERLRLLALTEARSRGGRAWLALRRAWEGLRERLKRIGWLRNAVRRLAGRKPLPGR
ncbi:MAG: GNAT family N-acetyltransferase [Roseococcus sp.]|nr:GNAT family N-acetyltransferase [Roseococcus sp.]